METEPEFPTLQAVTLGVSCPAIRSVRTSPTFRDRLAWGAGVQIEVNAALRNSVHADRSRNGNHVFQFAAGHLGQACFRHILRSRSTTNNQQDSNQKKRGTTTTNHDHLRLGASKLLAQEQKDTDSPGGKSVPNLQPDDCFSDRSILT